MLRRDSALVPISILRWHLAAAKGFAIAFVILAAWACTLNYLQPKGIDFVSFWSAARMAAGGDAASAYNIAAHRAVELSVAPVEGVLPFPYPPPFLVLAVPFGVAPFWMALVAWLIVTGGLYVAASRSVAPCPYPLAHPSVVANALIGQNGFLTSAIFIFGITSLQRRPLVAGAVLGSMVIKPQLALLLPVALLAGGEWRAIGGAALSSTILLLASYLLLGGEAYQGFFKILPYYAEAMRASRWPWNELASPFAFARFLGVPQVGALSLHALIGAVAVLLTIRAWALGLSRRVPILAASTMLIPPYLFTYDALLLMVPLGWLIREQKRPFVIAFIWVCCLLPVLAYFNLFPGPNTIPIAAILALWALHADELQSGTRGARPDADQLPDNRRGCELRIVSRVLASGNRRNSSSFCSRHSGD